MPFSLRFPGSHSFCPFSIGIKEDFFKISASWSAFSLAANCTWSKQTSKPFLHQRVSAFAVKIKRIYASWSVTAGRPSTRTFVFLRGARAGSTSFSLLVIFPSMHTSYLQSKTSEALVKASRFQKENWIPCCLCGP